MYDEIALKVCIKQPKSNKCTVSDTSMNIKNVLYQLEITFWKCSNLIDFLGMIHRYWVVERDMIKIVIRIALPYSMYFASMI